MAHAQTGSTARWGTLTLTACALTAALALAGCAGADPTATPKPSASESQSPTATQTPTPKPKPKPAPIVLPECEDMNATAEAEQVTFFASGMADDILPFDRSANRDAFVASTGPVAQEAAERTLQQRDCRWALYVMNSMTQYAAELPESGREPLVAALRASDYVESTLGSATVFTTQLSVEATSMGTITRTVTQLFLGDVWITIVDTGAKDYALAALDAILAANPTLASGAPAGTQAPDAPAACGAQTAATAIEAGAAQVAPRDGRNEPGIVGGWDVTQAIATAGSTFDPCAELSWVLLPTAGATGSSPTHIMFFNRGSFVGTDTATGIGFMPTITRLADDAISADYLYLRDGEVTATASGRAVSMFTWDESAKRVIHTGKFPPGYSG